MNLAGNSVVNYVNTFIGCDMEGLERLLLNPMVNVAFTESYAIRVGHLVMVTGCVL